MSLDRFIMTSFALAVLFMLLIIPSTFFGMSHGLAMIFAGLALFFSVCHVGGIVIACGTK